jgi:transcriptional regulator with XRE-family HTH domain
MNKKEKDWANIAGQRLYILRTYLGLSQQDLADKLSCNRRYISEWESGKRLISSRVLFKISEIFNVSIAHFNPREDSAIKLEKMSEHPQPENKELTCKK